MPLGLRASELAQVLSTLALILIVVFAADAWVSKSGADLVGPLSLAGSPFL